MTPSEKTKQRIGFTVKEKQAAYGRKRKKGQTVTPYMESDFGKYDSPSTKGSYIQEFREFTPKDQ